MSYEGENNQQLNNQTIIIPLDVPPGFLCDYISQTAKILSRKNQVIYFDISSPISIFNLIIDKKLRDNLFSGIIEIINKRENRIVLFNPLGIFPFQRIPIILRLNQIIGVWQLQILLIISKRKEIALWGFHPILSDLIGKMSESFSVYDCVDYYGDEIQDGEKNRRREKNIFRNATFIAFNSKALYKKKKSIYSITEDKLIIVPCGCNIKLFRKGSIKEINDYNRIPHPRVGFVGYLNFRLDFDLLFALIKKRSDWSFVFAGKILMGLIEDKIEKVEENINNLKSFPNVYFLGEIKKTDLPSVIKGFDVGIIPYQTKYGSVRYCNPMKAYEYLAMGKPVVANDILALKEIKGDAVTIAANPKEFLEAIKKYLHKWGKSDMLTALQVAKTHSWENKVSRIEEKIMRIVG